MGRGDAGKVERESGEESSGRSGCAHAQWSGCVNVIRGRTPGASSLSQGGPHL